MSAWTGKYSKNIFLAIRNQSLQSPINTQKAYFYISTLEALGYMYWLLDLYIDMRYFYQNTPG